MTTRRTGPSLRVVNRGSRNSFLGVALNGEYSEKLPTFCVPMYAVTRPQVPHVEAITPICVADTRLLVNVAPSLVDVEEVPARKPVLLVRAHPGLAVSAESSIATFVHRVVDQSPTLPALSRALTPKQYRKPAAGVTVVVTVVGNVPNVVHVEDMTSPTWPRLMRTSTLATPDPTPSVDVQVTVMGAVVEVRNVAVGRVSEAFGFVVSRGFVHAMALCFSAFFPSGQVA